MVASLGLEIPSLTAMNTVRRGKCLKEKMDHDSGGNERREELSRERHWLDDLRYLSYYYCPCSW